jgi:dienelactone hydrolase
MTNSTIIAACRRCLAGVWAAASNMKARHALGFTAILVVAIGYFLVVPVWPDEAFTVEPITFNTNVVAETTNDEEVEIEASLYLPKRGKFPISAVIIAPSSSGIEDEREIYYAKELTKVGIAALVIDSFKSRGLTNSLYDQSLLEVWDIENDAIAALEKLSEDNRFKRNRIAIMGVSKGGSAAMNSAFSVRRKWTGVDDVSFAAHVAISPDCTWTNRNVKTTGAPIFFMLAELDEQTPAPPCLEQVNRIKQAGNARVVAKVYTGAQHAWEELGTAPEYDAKAENYSQCRVWIEDDGQMFSADTGELVPEDDWRGWAQKNCMTLGTKCCGGTPQIRDAATKDLIAFLRRYRF